MNIRENSHIQVIPIVGIGLICYGVYSTFFTGTVPFLVGLDVEQKLILGLIWSFISSPQLYFISIRINSVIHSDGLNGLSRVVIFFILIPVYVYSILLNTISWFSIELPIPFIEIKGGIITGIIVFVLTTGPLYKLVNLLFTLSNMSKNIETE